jgi:DNA-binding transcriptional MerR regulator
MEGIQGNGHSESTAVADKSLFRIGEVSRVTATKPFVLRYWETEFPMLQPVKSPKGHRLYRREDIDTVFTIKRLLYNEGFTIAGARRHLRDQALGGGIGTNGSETPADAPVAGEQIAAPRATPTDVATLNRKTLLDLRDSLRSLLTALEGE